MKSKTAHSLIICLILTVGHLANVQAVTDAELEDLEKQIEQQEAEEKKQVEAEEKKKVEIEAKRKAETEAEKKRLIELEQRRKEEELKRKELEEKKVRELEIQRLLEEERMRKEEDEKLRDEIEKKEQYESHINKAAVYMDNENYNKAIEEYELLLKLFPGDDVANVGIKNAQKLLNSCKEIVGRWQLSHGPTWVINNDNSADGAWLIFNAKGEWKCLSARDREFVVSWPGYGWVDYFELSEDANTLNPIRSTKNTNISGSRIDDTNIDSTKDRKLPF